MTYKIPGGLPLTFVIPESVDCFRISIGPWFTTLSIWEITICAADCHIQDQIEVFIEWRVDIFTLPRIILFGVEFTFCEHILVMFELEHSLTINTSNNMVSIPF